MTNEAMNLLRDLIGETNKQLTRIADALEKANEVEVTGIQEIPLAQDSVYRAIANVETGPKYKEHNEIGKGPVMEKTCGKEVCRCLRNDGSCQNHHPEFCSKCRKLNNI